SHVHTAYHPALSCREFLCISGWSVFRGSCYLLSETSGSWYEGRADCRKRGGDLVVIDDDDEQKFVATLTGWSTWIGLSDRETEGTWKWVDGTPLNSELKKMWEDYQPDNGGRDTRNGEEDCVHIWKNLKKWNDLRCDASMQWICEKSPDC
uniref:C-type lectin domain-containing protein n=1 Tax=Poecilia reticulata TaxID=8081 RepID=A0A3P9N8Z6_POERE